MQIPLIEDLTNGPIPAGSNLLVEYDPASQWYNASITITAGHLRTGGSVNYSVAAQSPDHVRAQLKQLRLDVDALEKEEKLRIIDWYTATLGQRSKEKHAVDSLKAADLSILVSKLTKAAPFSPGVLRILDNRSTLARFNDEKIWVEFELSRLFPRAPAWKSTAIIGLIKGFHTDWAFKALEAAADGIIDFKLEESGEETKNIIRIRTMRNVSFDSRWHQLKIGKNFEVTLEK